MKRLLPLLAAMALLAGLAGSALAADEALPYTRRGSDRLIRRPGSRAIRATPAPGERS